LKAQPFSVTIDTINLNIKELVRPATRVELTHAVRYNDNYYCFFDEHGLYSYEAEIKYFLVISPEGEILHNITLPAAIQRTVYFDFFIRNNRLFSKTYMDSKSFHFDLNKLEWEKIKEIDDVVYEDDNFSIAYLDFGEWGECTWFIDKITKKEYELAACSKIVNFFDGKYYLTNGSEIVEIENPLNLQSCNPNYYYKETAKKKWAEGSNSRVGSSLIYHDTTFSPFDFEPPKHWIITSFVSDNKLYHFYSDTMTTYVVKVENKQIVPVQSLGKKYSTFDHHYSYRGNNLNNSYRFLKFKEDNNTFGFIEINNNKINIHYLKHNVDSLNYLGADGFATILSFISNNIDSMTIDQIDSIEKNLSGIDMRNYKIGISHNKYYPEIYNSKHVKTKRYIKVVDQFIAQTSEYLYIDSNKLVKALFIEWKLTNPYNESNDFFNVFFRDEKPEIAKVYKTKFKEIEELVTKQLGKSPTKEIRNNDPDNIQQTWISDNGLVIELYSWDTTFKNTKQIRMILYKEQTETTHR
jgi:hypothetical protein